MPVLACQHCGGNYEIEDSDIGGSVICPHCQQETACSAPQPAAGGAAEMARAFTQRVSDRSQLQKVPTVAWVMPLAAPIVTVLCHIALAAVVILYKPIPNIVVFWVPVILGVAACYYMFVGLTRSEFIGVPKWAPPVIMLGGFILSSIPTLITEKQYTVKVRRSLIQQVTQFISPPHLPADTAVCALVSVPERVEDATHTFQASLKDGRDHTLTADVKLYKAALVYDEQMEDLQCQLAESVLTEPLTRCLESYPHLKSLIVKEAVVTSTPKPGAYSGHAEFENGLNVAFTGKAKGKELACKLEPEAHVRALAIPLATELWKQFDPTSDDVCFDVKLGKKLGEGLRLCDAILSNEATIPVVIEQDPSDPEAAIDVFFQFREAAIVEINSELQEVAELAGDAVARCCVNVDKKEKLREQEYSLRAMFPEGDPLMVLARQDGHDVSIVPSEHIVLLSSAARTPENGWSMLVPEHYGRGDHDEFKRTVNSGVDKLELVLEIRTVSLHSKFALQEYAENERTKWGATRPQVELGEIASTETMSGLTGYRYTVVKGPALRIKYFFMHGANLAIITATSTEAEPGLTEKSDTIVSTLRFKDEVKE